VVDVCSLYTFLSIPGKLWYVFLWGLEKKWTMTMQKRWVRKEAGDIAAE
jgi:hypothetical protein